MHSFFQSPGLMAQEANRHSRICQHDSKSTFLILTRRERLKSALYLRLKKRKTVFLEKNLKFSKKKLSFGKCRTVPKNVKAFLIYKHAFCSKITKNSNTQTGDPLGTLRKFRKKVAQCRKKLKGGRVCR